MGKGGRLYNHAFFKFVSVDAHTVTLQDERGTSKIKHAQADQVLRLTYALTYASCDGMTLGPGVLRLHDTSHPRFCWQKLNVGLSRATASADVEAA